jgi:hypothetical protein
MVVWGVRMSKSSNVLYTYRKFHIYMTVTDYMQNIQIRLQIELCIWRLSKQNKAAFLGVNYVFI